MKRLAVVAMCVLLTGCAEQSLIDDPTSPSTSAPATDADSGSQAFVFDSGVLEIGDFDPYALGDDLFDPCTEITAEEFAAAGFDNVEPMPEEYAGLARGLSSCDVEHATSGLTADLSNSVSNRETVKSKFGIETAYSSTLFPDAYVFSPRVGTSTGCFAQIDTLRGGIVVGTPGIEMMSSRDENCNVSLSLLEQLLSAHAENR